MMALVMDILIMDNHSFYFSDQIMIHVVLPNDYDFSDDQQFTISAYIKEPIIMRWSFYYAEKQRLWILDW